jgi:hypothetical protein
MRGVAGQDPIEAAEMRGRTNAMADFAPVDSGEIPGTWLKEEVTPRAA